jgi:midasin
VNGTFLKVIHLGNWLLLDEINLAPREVLEYTVHLLELINGEPAMPNHIIVNERINSVPVICHPKFRLLASMNPAAEIGRNDLSRTVQNIYTEIFVFEPVDWEDLEELVINYLSILEKPMLTERVVEFYIQAKTTAGSTLTDSSRQRPNYNLRTLIRSLDYLLASAPLYGIDCALYDGFSMTFFTQLDIKSEAKMQEIIQLLLSGYKVTANFMMRSSLFFFPGRYILYDYYWLKVGTQKPAFEDDDKFVLIPTMRKYLHHLARALGWRDVIQIYMC